MHRRVRGARETPLFSALIEASAPAGIALVERDGDVRLYRGWLAPARADALFASLRAATAWVQERRKMYDRIVDVPRQQAWFGDDRERPFTPELAALRRDVEVTAGVRFSHVLLNRYRDGSDSVAWHHDREVEGMRRPVIASLTLGVTRAFDLRPKNARSRVISVDLDHGDLLIMAGDTQSFWEHRVAKDRRVAGERINLTFRQQPG